VYVLSTDYTLGFLLGTVLRNQEMLLENTLKDLEISLKEYALLMVISGSKQKPTQLEAGNQLRFDRTSVGQLIDGLCGKGFIERSPKPNDRRAYLLSLTAQGVDLLKQLRAIEANCTNICLSPLAPSDRSKFMNYLQTLIKGE
jgi:DNA-binding MarR family transcriptional regulator